MPLEKPGIHDISPGQLEEFERTLDSILRRLQHAHNAPTFERPASVIVDILEDWLEEIMRLDIKEVNPEDEAGMLDMNETIDASFSSNELPLFYEEIHKLDDKYIGLEVVSTGANEVGIYLSRNRPDECATVELTAEVEGDREMELLQIKRIISESIEGFLQETIPLSRFEIGFQLDTDSDSLLVTFLFETDGEVLTDLEEIRPKDYYM